MNPAFPIAENYEKLTPIVERLYHHTDHIAQIAILPLFLLSVLMAYSEDLGIQGAVVARLKRLVVTMLLLVAFPSLTGLIKNIGQEVALSIDNLEGIDQFLKSASNKASLYSVGLKSLLDFGNDLVVSLLVSISFLALYVARYLLVAFYHFYWMILLVTGPFMILGNLFESTANITKNLFRSLILVACWPIVWSILSAFLKALPFHDAYSIEGGYTAIVVMNLIIAIGLLFSPFMLSQFCEGAIVGMGAGIVSTGARAATAFVGPKAAAIATKLGERAYPAVRQYVPNRKQIYNVTTKVASALKPNALKLILLFPMLASASPATINVRPGLSSVVCFEKSPDSIAIGDGRYFQAQKMGNNLLLRSTVAEKETNLLIFAAGGLATSYKLQSSRILPHSESTNCDKKAASATSSEQAVQRVLSTAKKSGLRAELLRKAWESPKHDYFTIRIRLTNDSAEVWHPEWSRVTLKQGSKRFSHSVLSSERQALPPGARVTFDVQFTRPEIAHNRGFIEIPSKEGTLELLVEKGGK